MNRFWSVAVLVVGSAGSLLAESPESSEAAARTLNQLRTDIEYLASEELRGRSVADESIHQAADYIASRMEGIGLDIAIFDGSPLQELDISLGAQAGKAQNNRVSFSMGGEAEEITASLGDGMNPMAIGSGTGQVRGQVVFAGYGITAPKLGYDDYEGIDASGRVVIVIRKEPGVNDPNSPFNGTRNTPHAFFATKIENAVKHGAAALVIVNDPTSVLKGVQNERSKIFREQQRKTAIQKQIEQLPQEAKNNRRTFLRKIHDIDNMIRSLQTDLRRAQRGLLGVTEAGSRARSKESIPVLSLSRDVADRLLQQSIGQSLQSLEEKIDGDNRPHSHLLSDVSADLSIELKPTVAASSNVIGTLAGRGELADETIVVGAHYDHVGMGGYGSLAPGTIAIHNGADDNASGTAAMLSAARLLVEGLRGESSHRRLVFIAFTGEERGLLGSKHYVRHPRFSIESTAAMINLDMVGRLRDNELTVYGTGSASGLDGLVERANQRGGFNLYKVPTGYGPSDHQSFYQAGVPVLFFFTGLHNDYHRPTDDFDKIDFGGMVRITDIVSEVAHQLAIQKERPAYAETENRVRIRRQMTAFLGVTLSDRGDHVVLSGLASDGPAERGGLRAGDRLEKLGKKTVKTSSDVLEFLRGRSPGDRLPVQIIRDGKKIEISVQLEPRP